MKIAIVGAGMIGAAAARHLSAAGHDVTLIGPREPEAEWAQHVGVFASHYDEGRITRTADANPFYARAAAASIKRYGQIEAESGISFFTPCGALIAGRAGYMARVHQTGTQVPAPHDRLDAQDLADRFPHFSFETDISGVYEPTQAGHISPRRLVAAQIAIAEKQGVTVLDRVATSIAPRRVKTVGATIEADEVIVSTGGWTDTLLGRARTHRVYARTVAFHEIPQTEAERLANMPSLVLEHPDIYVLPPIRYPDGRLWLKLGGDPEDMILAGRDALNAWFRGGGSTTAGHYLTETLKSLMPALVFADRRIAPCVTTFTHDGLPEIKRLSPGLTIAAAGNGAGAKCSDELGRMAAGIVTET